MSNATTIYELIPRADIIKLGVRLGAEIRNLRLSDDLPDEVIRAINQLMLEHKVIFFRDQQPLNDAQHEIFAHRLGHLVPDHQIGTAKAMLSIVKPDSGLSGGRADQRQHTVIMVEGYPKMSLLGSVICPPYRGDTVWSDMAGAYQALPLSLRMLADQLWAVHSNDDDSAIKAQATGAEKEDLDEVFAGTSSETEYPVILVHPETGERMLSIGSFVQRFVGLQKYTGQKLFGLFQSYITAPENTVRWSWMPGDIAIWDRRATQYHEMKDHGDHHHLQGRATTNCDVSLSIDARRRAKRVNASKPRVRKAHEAYGDMQSRSSPR
ncbi:TauD/TfdA family dioxygenase [Bradyrhizobium sp. SSUT77]|uniref:TauD/TfdA dioxygenase family protein n=1 Tax=Bradyrhizobium sp. SSUT77 TaxID=3040603 RepID=UPI00244B9F65|nr:TauD/TfdA family dioxygenase [Bradyrhizobium sp. SSUT77]MDH2348314.1 TauD/TfdA family dioxygenase [Bradyrhizobium sp. SSUT77]